MFLECHRGSGFDSFNTIWYGIGKNVDEDVGEKFSLVVEIT